MDDILKIRLQCEFTVSKSMYNLKYLLVAYNGGFGELHAFIKKTGLYCLVYTNAVVCLFAD